MFNADFFPTPDHVIEMMVEKLTNSIDGKVILEPSAGKGDIVDSVKAFAKNVIAFEKEEELRAILSTKCNVMGEDFLMCKKEDISHVDIIIMNPPFSEQNKHIRYAFDIAPPGCEIVSLCNASLLTTTEPNLPQQYIQTFIKYNGYAEVLGNVFSNAECKTNVEVGLIYVKVPGDTYNVEFDGFFMEDTDTHSNTEGFMKYDFIRDIVNRQIEGVKLYDKVIRAHQDIKSMIGQFYNKPLMAFAGVESRDEFKKQSQKDAWMYLFKMLNMNKLMTKAMQEQINKFVEDQTKVPFTMKNVYTMLDIVIQTAGQRMDKAMEQAFDKITQHHKDNQFGVEGWATNSNYLLSKRFIVERIGDYDKRWPTEKVKVQYDGRWGIDMIMDLIKTLCYITGKDFDSIPYLHNFVKEYYFIKDKNGEFVVDRTGPYHHVYCLSYEREINKILIQNSEYTVHYKQYDWGEWFEWGFFRVRVYKRCTAHFEFLDENVWALYNQNIARIKGMVLPKEQKQKERKKPQKKTAAKESFDISQLSMDELV